MRGPDSPRVTCVKTDPALVVHDRRMALTDILQTNSIFIISDLHISDPENGLDDFHTDEAFEQLLTNVIPNESYGPATLVIAGDFIDFPQVLPDLDQHNLGDEIGITEHQSLAKLNKVIDGHHRVFGAMARFIGSGGTILLLPGNHDVDYHWPSVEQAIRDRLNDHSGERFRFVRETFIKEHGIYIEHGNQYSLDNRFDNWPNPIIEADDGPRLERCWGTMFMNYIYNDIELRHPFVNKVHPHSRLFWIYLRSLSRIDRPTNRELAKLIWFLYKKSRGLIPTGMVPTIKTVGVPSPHDNLEQFIRELPADRQEQVRMELKLLMASEDGPHGNEMLNKPQIAGLESPVMGISAFFDFQELTSPHMQVKKAQELLGNNEVQLVVFGHTHDILDGNEQPVFGSGDPRRHFNTGSWMPMILIGDHEKPLWEDLRDKPQTTELRYLHVELDNLASTRLMHLDSA